MQYSRVLARYHRPSASGTLLSPGDQVFVPEARPRVQLMPTRTLTPNSRGLPVPYRTRHPVRMVPTRETLKHSTKHETYRHRAACTNARGSKRSRRNTFSAHLNKKATPHAHPTLKPRPTLTCVHRVCKVLLPWRKTVDPIPEPRWPIPGHTSP